MPNGLGFNGAELAALTSQTLNIFNREGILIITNKLKQDGFFKKPEVTQESWCRLIDNLLFYSKTSEQWSEIKGVIVLERCSVRTTPQNEKGHWPFHLVWNDDIRPMHWLQLATFTECDRVGWLEAIQLASHEYIKCHTQELQAKLKKLINRRSDGDSHIWKIQKGMFIDLNEIPLCELSLSCDNLQCDNFERPPNPFLVIHVKVNGGLWMKYAVTEILDSTKNPRFVKTVMFRKNHGLDGETIIRVTAKDMREKVSNTCVTLGSTTVLLSTIQVTQRFRVALKNSERRTIGFLTLNGWSFETSHKEEGSSLEQNDVTPWRVYCHRRSQSLPITLNVKIKLPSHSDVAEHLFNNVNQATYRLQSDLGCEITVHEIMAESKFCFILPQELLGIWIQHEKEMLQEIICMGEMGPPWKANQMELLNKHFNLFNYYNVALDNISSTINSTKSSFKQSARKDDPFVEFIPVNLHIQRMWTHDYNLNVSGVYDTITVGAFTAHCQKSGKDGGLFQMVQQNKSSSVSNNISNPVQMANDAVQAIKQLRGEVVDTMSELLSLAKLHQSDGMLPLAEQMVTKTRALLSLWDSGLVEEALHFIDAHKVSSAFVDNDETLENAKMLSMLKRMNLRLNLNDMTNAEIDDFATPSTPCDDPGFLDAQAMSCSPSANYYQPNDEPEPWDLTQLNIEASVMCLVSKIKFLCGHCGSPAIRLRGQNAKSSNSVQRIFVSFNGNGNNNTCGNEVTVKISLDVNSGVNDKIVNSQNNNHSLDIPEENKNIHNEASKDDCTDKIIYPNQVTDTAKIQSKKSNRFTDGLNLADVLDWAAELRPSMRKLRQAMDGLLKGGRLAHAVLRIKQDQNELQKAIELQIRRDVCFSQALTSTVTALFCWLWSNDIETIATLLKSGLGPICYFEGLLTLHGNEIGMWGDMVIAIEDLQTVAFQLTRWNHRDLPLPQIKGSRTSLIIMLPIKADLFSKLSNKQPVKFTITPVYFNIGINAMATVAESLGETTAQHKSNADNYDRLNEYHLRYQKLNFTTTNEDSCKIGPKLKPTDEIMMKIKSLLLSKKPKNVELLQEASLITRRLNGIRIISCKSGKDRTGMSCTLEQCNILYRDFNLTRQEFRKILDCMRSEGCRRDNTMKNIGIRKYAFDKIEAMALPLEYQPPLGTYGSTQT